MRRLRWVFIFGFSMACYFWLIADFLPDKDSKQSTNNNISRTDLTTNKILPNAHLVLVWTTLFGNKYWHQESYFNTSTIVSCSPQHRCQFTHQRNKLSQASLIAFHLYDVTRSDLPERDKTKSDNQTWVFVTGESPMNFYYQNPSFYPQMFDNYFDRSISYKDETKFTIFSSRFQARTPNSTLDEKTLNSLSLQKKNKAIIWLVSNCVTFSQRETYVKELSKWISVDIYGKCGKKCPTTRQCQMNLSDYYFYLSFENSRCNSYISEKFWNILTNNEHRLVPIVMGARRNDYESVAPKHSFIHVDEYPTAKKLAEYLNGLIENQDRYLRYLQWRELVQIQPENTGVWMNFLCPLCEMAHETAPVLSDRLQFSTWFNPSTQCHHDDVDILKKCKQSTMNVWMSWVHKMKCP